MGKMHEVKQGEFLSLIARNHGFLDWHVIYDHPRNQEFRKRRPDPNIILPGDRLYIPDKNSKEKSCATTRLHRFKLKPPHKDILKLVLKDQTDWQPLANVDCVLIIGGKQIECKTNPNGLLEQEIPPGMDSAELVVEELGLRWPLKIGHLDPAHDQVDDRHIVSGIQARLNNLGFPCGAVDNVLGAKTKAALKRFQRAVLKRENPDGELDAQTRQALCEKHNC